MIFTKIFVHLYSNSFCKSMTNISNNTSNASLHELLKRGDITRIHEITGLNRSYISEFLDDPINWEGSTEAKNKILDGIEQVRKEREEKKQNVNNRIAKLLNEAEVL